MLAGEQADDRGLQRVGVLVLVDHEVAVPLRELAAHVVVLAQELVQLDEEIVVVDELALGFVLGVGVLQAEQVFGVLEKVGVGVLDEVGERAGLVDRHAEHLGDRLLAREASFLLVEPELGAQQADDVLGVAAIEDGEAAGQPERRAVAAQRRVGERVEGAAGDLLAAPVEQRRGAAEHLGRRLAGEGEQEDGARVDAELDQAGDAEAPEYGSCRCRRRRRPAPAPSVASTAAYCASLSSPR